MGRHSRPDPELDRRAFFRRGGLAVATGAFLAVSADAAHKAQVPDTLVPETAAPVQAAMTTDTPVDNAATQALRAVDQAPTSTPAPPTPPTTARHAAPTRATPPSVATPPGSSLRARIIASARTYFGIQYVWGGTTRAGLDCSGLVYLVMRDVGIRSPRTAATLASWSTRIPASQAQPGDLVFEGSPATHVGIVVRPGVMINAPTFGTVVREDKIRAGMFYGRIPAL